MATTKTARFTVHSVPQSPVGRKLSTPHLVVDTTTNSVVDEYASKKAAQMDAKFRNDLLQVSR